ncbi:MAG: helical backbone metal receptor [Bacteroidota bacterium]|nr:helical backbone metal receptor [Bacteroidota bacterium]
MLIYTDQLNNKLKLTSTPKRIISIVPSQSEFLWEIGIRKELIGITKFCIHPNKMFTSIERVGGTKKLNFKKIRALKPDLIIANKEENNQQEIELLQKEFNVWISDIYNFKDAFKMMEKLSIILNKEAETQKLITDIKASLRPIKNIFKQKTVAYFIWNKPYMLAASNTYINFILNYLGLTNATESMQRYPEVDNDALKKLNPNLCFLSSEPFPFKQKHVLELQQILPNSKILIVDGEVFSWYGPRMVHLADFVKQINV